MVVDNFAYFEQLLPFAEGVGFLVYLHRRWKENPDVEDDFIDGGNPEVLKGWWIVQSAEQLEALKAELVAKSAEYKARVYIKPTPIHLSDLKEQTFTAALLTQRQGDNLYIIDCDKRELPILSDIKATIEASFPDYPKLVYEVPSVSGVHLIVKPFLLQEFKRKYPNIHFGISRGTVLYYNKS